MNPDLERLINMAKESGELTEKQKSIILRKAEELGEDIEEVEMVLETVKSKSVSKDSASEKKKKCPVCGAVVSYEARCPECGFAFDRIETSTSITNFFEELRLIHPRKYSQKKQVIESFPIPNSKKDLLDFIILMKPLASDPQDNLVDTYLKKYSECLERAKTYFPNDLNFKPFLTSYDEIKQSSKKGHFKRWIVKNKLLFLFLFVSLIVAVVALLIELDANRRAFDYLSGKTPKGTEPLTRELSLKDKSFSSSGSIGEYEYVDLGLSVKWATKNIGANKINDVGDYFAWGEVKTKDQYYEESYFDYSNNLDYIKYNQDSRLNQLDDIDDAAHRLWGFSWRMPTVKEVKELIDNCSFQLCEVEDVSGILITSDLNSNSIFIPCSGYVEKDMFKVEEMDGFLWTSSLDLEWIFREYAFVLKVGFLGEEVIRMERYYGFPIRPVSQ